jgi:hypothetical protein
MTSDTDGDHPRFTRDQELDTHELLRAMAFLEIPTIIIDEHTVFIEIPRKNDGPGNTQTMAAGDDGSRAVQSPLPDQPL